MLSNGSTPGGLSGLWSWNREACLRPSRLASTAERKALGQPVATSAC
jgi:hypothetical protein